MDWHFAIIFGFTIIPQIPNQPSTNPGYNRQSPAAVSLFSGCLLSTPLKRHQRAEACLLCFVWLTRLPGFARDAVRGIVRAEAKRGG